MIDEAVAEQSDYYRCEAMGAFAHEIRTPLTSLRMVVELARRQSAEDGSLRLDAELASMLHQSIADLQQLADDLQEQSRMERGRVELGSGPCDLRAAFAAAAELLSPHVTLVGEAPEPIDGPWEAPRLVRALAGFAESANRIGDGDGTVRFKSSIQPHGVLFEFASGSPSGEEKPVAADAGFSFFRSRQYILAAGGSVECTRSDRFSSYVVTIPFAAASG